MIPRVIHYCWFGNGEKPELAVKCIRSWKKYLPDYEIKEWNEKNYNIESCCDYVKEAYAAKKWAFVSDYVRFDILYKFGGIYFDTDVEVIKPIEDILCQGAFFGAEVHDILAYQEDEEKVNTAFGMVVAPGLGMAALPRLDIYKEILDSYYMDHFLNKDGTLNKVTVVSRMTDILKKHGFQESIIKIQNIEGVYIYPPEYFSPLVYRTGELRITENTRTIHHYMASWKAPEEKKMKDIDQMLERLFGKKKGKIMSKIVNMPLRIKMKITQYGILGTISLMYKHYFKYKK